MRRLDPVPPKATTADVACWTEGQVIIGAIAGPLPAPRLMASAASLGYLASAVASNDIIVTSRRGAFRSTFTNGILAAQWLRNVLLEDGVIEPDELITKLENSFDPHRKYLAGDVIPLIHELFERKGKFYLGLYELEDKNRRHSRRQQIPHPRHS
jgi:hypothetical protein